MMCEFIFPVFCLFPIWVAGIQVQMKVHHLCSYFLSYRVLFSSQCSKESTRGHLALCVECGQCSVLLVCFNRLWVDSELMAGVLPVSCFLPFLCDHFPFPIHSFLTCIHIECLLSTGCLWLPWPTSWSLKWHHILQMGGLQRHAALLLSLWNGDIEAQMICGWAQPSIFTSNAFPDSWAFVTLSFSLCWFYMDFTPTA